MTDEELAALGERLKSNQTRHDATMARYRQLIVQMAENDVQAARRRHIHLWVYGIIGAATAIAWAILWPLWAHMPWWQSLLLFSAIQGATLNLNMFTRLLLGLSWD